MSMEDSDDTESPGDALEEYNRMHERGQELLDSSYNKEKFNSVIGSFLGDPGGLDQALRDLRERLFAAGPEIEKEQVRRAWLEEEDLLTPALKKGEEADLEMTA